MRPPGHPIADTRELNPPLFSLPTLLPTQHPGSLNPWSVSVPSGSNFKGHELLRNAERASERNTSFAWFKVEESVSAFPWVTFLSVPAWARSRSQEEGTEEWGYILGHIVYCLQCGQSFWFPGSSKNIVSFWNSIKGSWNSTWRQPDFLLQEKLWIVLPLEFPFSIFFPLVLFLPSWFHKNFYLRNSEKETEASGFQFSSVQLFNCVQLFETGWTAALQAFLSITNSRSPPKPSFTELVMPSNLLLLPSMFPSIRVFSSESALRIRWPNYWSFSFNISPLLTLK